MHCVLECMTVQGIKEPFVHLFTTKSEYFSMVGSYHLNIKCVSACIDVLERQKWLGVCWYCASLLVYMFSL